MGHVLHDAKAIREKRRKDATAEYAAIMKRYDQPEPNDAARLLELMRDLNLDDHDVAVHVEGVEICRRLSSQLGLLRHEQRAVAAVVGPAKKAAAENIASTHWFEGSRRAEENSKVAALENQANPGRIVTLRDRLIQEMRALPMIFSQADISAA